jgi:SAM-dependent methyltransferase
MKDQDKAFLALSRMHRDLEDTVSNELLSGLDRLEHYRKGHYPHIPLSEGRFLRLVEAAEYVARHHLNRDPERMTFLDVGCGIGTKLSLAKSYFGNVRGVEVCEAYAQFANSKFLRSNTVEIVDGRYYDKYREVDVIYMYSPFQNHPLQIELELAAYRRAAFGTLFIECLKHNYNERAEPFLRKLCGARLEGLFLKTRSKRLADKISEDLAANRYHS